MLPASSTSRTDFQPNSDEINKAVVLSMLAYLDTAQRKEAIENNSTTLFVSFTWRFCIQDMFNVKVAGRDEFSKNYGEAGKDVRGLFHNELFQRITTNIPSVSYSHSFKAVRIIFSGHSSAGALAHLFLICYMLKTWEETKTKNKK